jgi:hypothetical protein
MRNLRSASFGLMVVGMLGALPASAGAPQTVWRPTLVLGAVLPTDSGVKAGTEGAEWALPGGARLVAAADAELRVIMTPQHLNLGSRKLVSTYTVVLKSGAVRAIVPTAATSAVLVAAPKKASALIAAGEASVIASTQVAVANHHGSTSVGSAGQAFRQLPEGSVDVIGGGRHTLLAAPASVSGPSVLVTQDATVELGALSFAPVEGAHAYRVELREQKSERLVARTETPTPSVPSGLARLAPGGYRLRLFAVDDAGFESPLPLERPLHVVRLGVPAGAYTDATGAVYLPPGSRLTLDGSSGVEMSYGHGGSFIAAPPSLELLRSEPRLVSFRAAGAAEAVEVWLMPRKARAVVEFGSRSPHWPGEPLAIGVRIDEANRSAATWADVKPTVLVGVESVPVAFKRDGAWLRGVLPARPGVGPWVVRVEVKDPSGLELGRDFVEVASAEPAAP